MGKTNEKSPTKDSSASKTVDPRKNPWNNANPISLLFFSWMLPIFRKGFKIGLDPPDLFSPPKIYESERLASEFNKKWEDELEMAKKKGKQPSLLSALLKICRRNLIVYFIILTFDELVIRILQPITLRMVIKSFEPNTDISRRDQIIYGAAICACTFFHNFVMEHCAFLMLRTGMLCRVSLSTTLYQKILKLSPFARKNATTGKLTNIMANDLGRFDLGFLFLGYTILAPIQVGIFIYFLWDEIGTATLGSASLICLIMPLQVLNGTWTTKFRENIAKQTDERSRIMNEIIIAVRVIKMMAWESPFAQLVNQIRKTEVKALGKKMYLKGLYLSMFTVCIKLTPFLSILWYVLNGNRITADKAFFVVAVSAIIIENMVYYFSIAVASIGEVWISIGRLQEILLMEEQKENIYQLEFAKEKDQIDTSALFPEPKIIMTNATAKWGPDESPSVSNFNLNLEGDTLVMIVGAVGSGKSSFLHTLISELPLSSGDLKISGSVSYAAQEAWLFAGTVKDNVVFGKEFNEQLYTEVIQVSALEDDFKQLPNGEMTIVGERGMSLSGGQKARINLARALYRDADIVVLDDPLSAVDSRVSKHIFDKCIRKYLRGRIRILATHQLQYLPMADYVIVLKQGKILSQGTPTEIQNQELDLTKLLEDDLDAAGGGSRRTSALNAHENHQNDIIADDDSVEDESDSTVEGIVSFSTYWQYMRSGDSVFGLIAIISLFALGQIIITLVDFWLSLWTSAEESAQADNREPLKLEKPYWDILNSSNYFGDRVYLGIYGVLIALVICIALTRAVTCFRYFLQISVNLHNRMFESLIRAPVKFFDDNPSGRIMNRFTKDIGSIDELLPGDLYDSIEYLLQCCGVIVVVVLSNYYLAIPAVIIVTIVLFIRHIFIKTSRDLKRIESQARSPVFSHLATTVQGITTIRSLKTQDDANKKFYNLMNVHTSPFFLFISSIRCFTVWIGTISSVFLTAIVVTFLILSKSVAGGLIGFVITSTISLTTNLQWSLREAAEAENNMTSVARALEYTTLPSEAAWESPPDKKPPSDWPSAGAIKFNRVSLAYTDTDVLKNVEFEIKPKQKIGIVGRTGAGKSTIISALFRMTEPRGEIKIDDINIQSIGLHDLRKNISIIPQDPVLFSGSIRRNLDPFNQYNDEDIWKALCDVKLNDEVNALDAPVEDGGANFSIGQRQLICLARAILRKNRIILMDEATASVDNVTDAFIQKTIRQKFKDCSIIIIAHRLQTVMDCDKILVMEKGCLMEYDHPHILLQNEEGFLHRLVSYTGSSTSIQLKEIARNHYEHNYDGTNGH